MQYDVIVIGGGLSGLSAATELSGYGLKICLLERKRFLGGRTYSFTDEITGDVVDNGQHLMMGCYHATLEYLETIKTKHLAALQKNLHIEFLHPGIGRAELSCLPLSPPFHILSGLLRLKTLSFRNRFKLLRVGHQLLSLSNAEEESLDAISVEEWLRRLGQPPENRRYLWDVIAIGSLNDDPAKVSALMFYRVLKTAFTGTQQDAAMLIPRVGLSELFVEPGQVYIIEHGGEIRKESGIDRLLVEGKHIRGVQLSDGSEISARAYILAIPYFDLLKIVESSFGDDLEGFRSVSQFTSSAILTINLWLDRTVFRGEFAAVLDSRIQWIFNRSRLLGHNLEEVDENRQFLSVVVSGANEYSGTEKEKLVTMAMEDLRWVIPEAKEANVLHSVVLNEKRATLSPKPGMNNIRPKTKTEFPNLFLAGDWTQTGLPATIEGAILSGKEAGNAAREVISNAV